MNSEKIMADFSFIKFVIHLAFSYLSLRTIIGWQNWIHLCVGKLAKISFLSIFIWRKKSRLVKMKRKCDQGSRRSNQWGKYQPWNLVQSDRTDRWFDSAKKRCVCLILPVPSDKSLKILSPPFRRVCRQKLIG